jgi:hypothetical protein
MDVMNGEGENSVRRAYSRNHSRLQKINMVYDPHNLFSLNQNIQQA